MAQMPRVNRQWITIHLDDLVLKRRKLEIKNRKKVTDEELEILVNESFSEDEPSDDNLSIQFIQSMLHKDHKVV
ncbi:hypothetical protein QE152_g23459 [Popillia japonica]|uniref:Uncharacterized protein n=1 Tax=Popillia japonica TaxID=7064 RepID=A0AAW1KF78_POPJA